MDFKSKKSSLVILGLTALVCSRGMFAFFNDPEGPNVLVVAGTALVVYLLSLTIYLQNSSIAGLKKLTLAILIQIVLATILYVYFK